MMTLVSVLVGMGILGVVAAACFLIGRHLAPSDRPGDQAVVGLGILMIVGATLFIAWAIGAVATGQL